MQEFLESHLWKATLAAPQAADPYSEPRRILRDAFLSFRQRAEILAAEIARDLPSFTVHDISHLDALWETAGLIAGENYSLTPSEVFVLGCSFLIHDLGMGLAAYPGGLESVRQDPRWSDLLTQIYLEKNGCFPTQEQLDNPDAEIQLQATAEVLRILHAKQAEALAFATWQSKSGEVYHLLENTDLRVIYGKLIGRIAHSHWWQASALPEEFMTSVGAPTFAPPSWTVDALKLSCLLRVADAAHLDARRAPGFLRTIRRPAGISDEHWQFQSMLQKPQVKEDRLVFTSPCSLPIQNAPAWWLCYETLKMVDWELDQVDRILGDHQRPRLRARAVAGVDSPRELTAYIPTDHWIPIDASVRVGDVAELVKRLGGAALYGDDPIVPLRELIQNASDAIRARRVVDETPDWGAIFLRLGKDGSAWYVEVEDNGIGMSEKVLTGALLDFGNSYWSSPAMIHDFPGLLSSGFRSTGKYGIGFFHFSCGAREFKLERDALKTGERKQGFSNSPMV